MHFKQYFISITVLSFKDVRSIHVSLKSGKCL